MLLYCLKWRKKQALKTQGLQTEIEDERCFYQKMPCEIIKNQDLPKSKKQVGY